MAVETGNDLAVYLRERAELVERELDRLLPAAEAAPGRIHEAMRYSTLGGGKRLRPILFLAAAEVCGCAACPGDRPADAPVLADLAAPACSVELIHAYSLVHDDLPSMDDDDFRRGKPSCHRAFDEATAVLAGDALLTLAFEVLARQVPGVPAARQLRAVGELARAAGTAGLIGGQMDDLAAEGRAVDERELCSISARKTGALFQASVRCGALLAGAGEQELAALTAYALEFGLAFQITDDILDADSGAEVSSDMRKGKATFPALLGIAGARAMAGEAVRRAVEHLAPFGKRGERLAALAEWMLERSG